MAKLILLDLSIITIYIFEKYIFEININRLSTKVIKLATRIGKDDIL